MKQIPSIEIIEVAPDVHQIIFNKFVYAYLVVGNEKALLIDSGWGMANLKKRISSITRLPLVAVNTHGHLDHMYGSHQFDEVYIHDDDRQMMMNDYTQAVRARTIAGYDSSKLLDGITETEWINAAPRTVKSLNGLPYFDIGGRRIEIIETPGHTKGSVCFLDSRKRLLFTGDSLYKGYMLMHFNLSAKMSQFLESLKRLHERKNDFDYIMPGHGKINIEAAFVDRVIDGVEKILSGERRGEAGEFYSRPAMTCRFEDFFIVYREDYLR